MLRALLGGEEWDFGGGAVSRLRDPVRVPLSMAASGPRNLRLAGEIADGVVLLSGVSPETLAMPPHGSGKGRGPRAVTRSR